MIDWHLHRFWLGMMVAALVIGIGSTPLLKAAQQKAASNLASLKVKSEAAEKSLQQFENDSAEAERMKNEIDAAEAEKQLAPVDRLRTAQIIENRAQESYLSKFTYTLSPEEKISLDTVGAGKQELANSKLTLTADAPTDNAVYQFLDALAHSLPGRFTLRHITLQRMAGTAVTAANIHMTAEGDWLSNGAVQNLAGEP